MSIIVENIILTTPKVEGKASRKIYLYDGREHIPENAIQAVYEKKGYKVLWTENTFWSKIMTLLFWDVIYSPVYGAVTVSMQGSEKIVSPKDPLFASIFSSTILMNGMPSDFFTGKFYENRKSLILKRLEELRSLDLAKEVESAHSRHRGKNCRPIEDWSRHSVEELREVLNVIDRFALLDVLHRLLVDYSSLRSGFPDLFAYSDEGDYLFIEVKSENDKLSDHQRAWLKYLSEVLKLAVTICVINHSERKISNIRDSLSVFVTPPKIEHKAVLKDDYGWLEGWLRRFWDWGLGYYRVSTTNQKVLGYIIALLVIPLIWSILWPMLIASLVVVVYQRGSRQREEKAAGAPVMNTEVQYEPNSNNSAIIDLHFKYLEGISENYRVRNSNKGALEKAITACRAQIEIAPKVKQALLNESWGRMPTHTGFKQLAIIEQKRGNYTEAIRLCEEARIQGWNGDWEKRIARYKKMKSMIS